MSNAQTFVDALLSGNAELDDIDDWVGRWHDQAGAPNGNPQELDDFLGFTEVEYSLWVERPSSLRLIAAARHRRTSIDDVQAIATSAQAAARTSDDSEAQKLLRWLKKTGRI